jgi:hypothetical protein
MIAQERDPALARADLGIARGVAALTARLDRIEATAAGKGR